MDRSGLLAIVEDSVRLKTSFFERNADAILEAGRVLVDTVRGGHKVLVFGNGGSAADAQHFAAELVNRYRVERQAVAAVALTTDSSILTSVANDDDYARVFSRQIEALGQKGDASIAISTSGNSPSVLEGARLSRARGLTTIALSGRDGGKLAPMVDLALVVPHPETARIQEVHAMLIHLFCEMIDEAF